MPYFKEAHKSYCIHIPLRSLDEQHNVHIIVNCKHLQYDTEVSIHY
jgi:hypothetical protein